MALITIPYDYDERAGCSIVPICINDIDSRGNLIHRAWVDRGVVPGADLLRKVAARILGDVWRVSEIVEPAVHSLSHTRGDDLGDAPEIRVLKRAHGYAADLRVGGRRARRKSDVELFTSTLDALEDRYDWVAHFHAKDTLDRLIHELERLGLDDVRAMVPMMLNDCDARAFTERFGKSRNTISQRFYRGMRQAARAAGISW